MKPWHLWSMFLLLATSTDCIKWIHRPNTQKCLKEELQQNVLLLGEYEVTTVPGRKVNYVVRDSKGHILSQHDDIGQGRFSFVTETYDSYEICFISYAPRADEERDEPQIIELRTKHGVEAKNYEGIGEAAKLKPIEVELKKLEDLSLSIVEDFSVMRSREEEMRNTNESTNSRVLYFSIFSMCCLLGLATWQVLYLRRYFKAKKLIE